MAAQFRSAVMTQVAMALLALLAWQQPAAAVRVDMSLTALVEDEQPNLSPDPDTCTTQMVQDGVRCGVDEVVKMIEDGVRCGLEWCNVPPAFLCPKRCEQTVRENKTCEILVSCPVRVVLHITGSSSTASISNMQFEAELIDYTIEQKSGDIQDTLDGNREQILPILNEVLDIGMPIANRMLSTESTSFETELMRTLQSQIANGNGWTSLAFGGSSGFDEGFMTAVMQRFQYIGADMHRRFEAVAPTEEGDGATLCHRLLRVTPKGGNPYLLEDWDNAVVARTYDNANGCSSVWTAHCHTGRLVQTEQCPLKDPTTRRLCLWSSLCWTGSRTIPGSQLQAVTLFKGSESIEHQDEVYIDHVGRSVASSSVALPAQAVESPADVAEEGQVELDTLVQIKDDALPTLMLDEICSRYRQNAWWGTGGIQAARCGVILRRIMATLNQRLEFKIGSEDISADVAISSGEFRVEFIPDWASLSAIAEAALIVELDKETFPMNIKVQSLNLKLGGDAVRMTVEMHPEMTGTISARELQELKDRLLTTPAP